MPQFQLAGHMWMVNSMSQTDSNWEKYLAKTTTRQARPWHLLNPGMHIDQDSISARLEICNQCEKFISVTKQCRECGCIMPLKARLNTANCPLGKW